MIPKEEAIPMLSGMCINAVVDLDSSLWNIAGTKPCSYYENNVLILNKNFMLKEVLYLYQKRTHQERYS